MLTEDYCNFETAKLLKEKGFDEITFTWYNGKGKFCVGKNNYDDYYMNHFPIMEKNKNKCSAPTIQMALKWLREVHNICIETLIVFPTGKNGEPFFNCNYWSLKSPFNLNVDYEIESRYFKTYEEAQEEAIKYCLENLL